MNKQRTLQTSKTTIRQTNDTHKQTKNQNHNSNVKRRQRKRSDNTRTTDAITLSLSLSLSLSFSLSLSLLCFPFSLSPLPSLCLRLGLSRLCHLHARAWLAFVPIDVAATIAVASPKAVPVDVSEAVLAYDCYRCAFGLFHQSSHVHACSQCSSLSCCSARKAHGVCSKGGC